jgi:D-alanyl-D-alanine carboxypeptidase
VSVRSDPEDGLFSDDLIQRLRRRVEVILGVAGPPGAVVALIVDGELWSDGIGYRDLERTRPLAADSLLSIYSVTKMMIAASVLKLVERNLLGLDQAVVLVLPEAQLTPEVTVHHLLNHTSGLADYGGMPEYVADLKRDPTAPWSEQAFLDRILAEGAQFAPGRGWAYANVGYLLLRRILERVTGHTFQQVLTDDIFRPLGLRQARVVTTLTEARGLAPGFSTMLSCTGLLEDVAPRYHPGWVSHGVVAATASEVAIFVDGLLRGKVVGPALVAEMCQGVAVPGSHPRFTRPTYGLGLMIDPDSAFGQVAGHGGGGPGYAVGAFQFGDVGGRQVTSVGLVNGDGRAWGEEIAFGLVEELVAMKALVESRDKVKEEANEPAAALPPT